MQSHDAVTQHDSMFCVCVSGGSWRGDHFTSVKGRGRTRQSPGNSLSYAKLEAFTHSHWWITSHSLWFLSDCNLQFTISLARGFQAWHPRILISAFIFVLRRLSGDVRESLIHSFANIVGCNALPDHLHLLCLIDHTNSASAHRSANENSTFLPPAALSQNRNWKIHCGIVSYTHIYINKRNTPFITSTAEITSVYSSAWGMPKQQQRENNLESRGW